MQGNFDDIVAEQTTTGRTLLCVCPNSEYVVRSALAAFHQYNAPLLFVATLNQVDSDGGYTGWTPAKLNGIVSAEIERQNIDGPVFLCLDHGGPWKKRRHKFFSSHDECLRATKTSIRECINAGYTAIHIDATGTNTVHQTHTDLSYQVELTLELQDFAEEHATTPLYFEVGTRENELGSEAESLFIQFVDAYFSSTAVRGLRSPTFCVGDVGTASTPGMADQLRLQRFAAISEAHGSGLKVHFADDVPNLSAFPGAGVRAANIGPGISAVEYFAMQELCTIAGAPTSVAQNLNDALRSSLVEAGLWFDLVGPTHNVSTQLSRQRLGYASRYVWTAHRVVESRAEICRIARRVLDPDEFVQQRVQDYIANYLVHFGFECQSD